MTAYKELFYDWAGANEVIFKTINGLAPGPLYDHAMLLVTQAGDRRNLPYILLGLCTYALASLLFRKIAGKAGVRQSMRIWIGVFCVILASYGINGILITEGKEYFAYPRPFIALPSDEVRVVDVSLSPDKFRQSFPSGHAAFTAMLVAALWPILSQAGQWLGVATIVLVCWSRIALGVHFPADVLGGAAMSLLVVFVTRAVIYRVLRGAGVNC